MENIKWESISSNICIKNDTKTDSQSIWIQNSSNSKTLIEIIKSATVFGVVVDRIELRVMQFTDQWLSDFKELLNALSIVESWNKEIKSVYIKLGRNCLDTKDKSKIRWDAFESLNRPIIQGQTYASKPYKENGIRLYLSGSCNGNSQFFTWLQTNASGWTHTVTNTDKPTEKNCQNSPESKNNHFVAGESKKNESEDEFYYMSEDELDEEVLQPKMQCLPNVVLRRGLIAQSANQSNQAFASPTPKMSYAAAASSLSAMSNPNAVPLPKPQPASPKHRVHTSCFQKSSQLSHIRGRIYPNSDTAKQMAYGKAITGESSDDEVSEDALAWQLHLLKIRDNKQGSHSDSGPRPLDGFKQGGGSITGAVIPKPKYPNHQPEALNLLQQITGKTVTELKSALYKTFIVPRHYQEYMQITKYVRNGQDHGFGIEVVNIIRIIRYNDFEFKNASGRTHLQPHRQQQSSPCPPRQRPQTIANVKANPYSFKQQASFSSSANSLLEQNPALGFPPLTSYSAKPINNHFRMILWHGIKKQNVASILLNGFAIPQAKNQMFGTGIYFVDRASKSAQYCDGTSPQKEGYMFLCDVKLGKMYTAQLAHVQAPDGYDSVKCYGKRSPDWRENEDMNGAVLPFGRTIDNPQLSSYNLEFNEYIAYEPERVKAKYLVVVKFHTHPIKRRDS